MEKIIDIHAHIFPQKISQKATNNIGNFYGIEMDHCGDTNDLLQSGQAIGVTRYVVQSVATAPNQVQNINDFIKDEVDRHSDQLIGFGTLHPAMDNVEAEVERIQQMGLRGIKLHPDFQRFNIDDQQAMPIYKAIAGRLPLLIHTGDHRQDYSNPIRMRRVMDKFPDLIVIAAHFGGWMQWKESKQCLSDTTCYVDTCSSLDFLSVEEAQEMVAAFGEDRVLFGTDFPMWDHKEEMERFNRLNLSATQREKILWGNAARLLGE